MPFDGRQPAPQDQEAHAAANIIKGVFDGLRDEVGAFVSYESADKGNKGFPGVKAVLKTKSFFTPLFTFLYGLRRIVVFQVMVSSGVPDLGVNPIEDAAALTLFIFEQRFETHGAIAHFLKVSRTHGGDLPGAADAAGKGVEGAFPFEQPAFPDIPF